MGFTLKRLIMRTLAFAKLHVALTKLSSLRSCSWGSEPSQRGNGSAPHLVLDAIGYEHQNPLASVAELIWLHLPGPGLPVEPHSRQIQELPCWSRKTSRHVPAENCVQQPWNVQFAAGRT